MPKVHKTETLNIDKVCRICLIEEDNMKSVYSRLDEHEILEIKASSLSEILIRITNVSITPNDGFPSLVCTNCILLIHGAYKFKIQFERTQSILHQCISDSIKQEIKLDLFNNEEAVFDQSRDIEKHVIMISHEQLGKRQTSRQQIQKRQNNVVRDSRQPKRRGRKPKLKLKNLYTADSDEENDAINDIDATEKNKNLHSCPVCTKEFTALALRDHAHTHKALKKYLTIPLENKVTSTTKFYRKYDDSTKIVGLNSKKEKLHTCVLCGLEFNAKSLQIHLQTHRNQTEYRCDQCQRVFRKLNHLNTHRVKHLKECPFKCDQCGKGFVIKKNYECHVLTHNTNQELPHECNYCLKRFSNPEHLNRHMVIHTENITYSVKYKVCKCHQCLQTFKDRSSLKSHECVPVDQAVNTRFPCKVCNKVFKNSSGLYNHNRNIHKLKGAKVLCSVCGNYVSNIYNHMMRHSGEKPYQCNQCGKRFIAKPQLRQHLLVHSGLKPFVCSVCAKAFNNLYNLQVHERIHKGDRCHICTVCNKGFLEKSYLKKHMNVHTKVY